LPPPSSSKIGKFTRDKIRQNLCLIFYPSELFDETVFWEEGCGPDKLFSLVGTHDENGNYGLKWGIDGVKIKKSSTRKLSAPSGIHEQ